MVQVEVGFIHPDPEGKYSVHDKPAFSSTYEIPLGAKFEYLMNEIKCNSPEDVKKQIEALKPERYEIVASEGLLGPPQLVDPNFPVHNRMYQFEYKNIKVALLPGVPGVLQQLFSWASMRCTWGQGGGLIKKKKMKKPKTNKKKYKKNKTKKRKYKKNKTKKRKYKKNKTKKRKY